MTRSALLALFAALVLSSAGHAAPGRIAVGITDPSDAQHVAELVREATGGTVDETLADVGAIVVSVDAVGEAAGELAELPGVTYVEPVRRSRVLAYQPTDPLVSYQWYLSSIRAFEFWDALPVFGPVRVAVIDSGIDASHPEFPPVRIAATKSYVGSKATEDTNGHGTIVAGEIAAALDNAEGIAGVGFPVELLVAKVVRPDGSISVEDEAEAIRWAVDNGALVINLSLGGVRDPTRPPPRRVLGARARRDRLRVPERRRGRGGNGQLHSRSVPLRELSGRAFARGRRERLRSVARDACVLES